MKCPFCAHIDDKVIDSREAKTGGTPRQGDRLAARDAYPVGERLRAGMLDA